MNVSDTLDRPCRTLVEYAEELRDKISELDSMIAFYAPDPCAYLSGLRSDWCRRLLAVERELNWRAPSNRTLN